MTIVKDFSLVADSTDGDALMYSDTPSATVLDDGHDELPVVKRARQTYGRRRPSPPWKDDPDSSMTSLSSVGSHSRVVRTGPPGMDEEVPSTSPVRSHPSSPRVNEYPWQRRLKGVDLTGKSTGVTVMPLEIERPLSTDASLETQPEYLDEVRSNVATAALSNSASLPDATALFSTLNKLTKDTDGATACRVSSPALSDDDSHLASSSKFQFSWKRQLKAIDDEDTDEGMTGVAPAAGDMHILSRNTEDDSQSLTHVNVGRASSMGSPKLQERMGSTSPSPRLRRRKFPPKAHSSNLEREHVPTSPPSPSFPYPFNTPKLQSSQTPPTSPGSEADIPRAPLTIKKQDKGKGKLREVASLDSSQVRQAEQSTTRNKKPGKQPKIKAPTKKEILETERERARIMAEQHFSIPRVSGSKYTLGSLFQSVQRPGVFKGTEPSDPIQPFSSSPALPSTQDWIFATDIAQSPSRASSRAPSSPPQNTKKPLQTLDSDSDAELAEVGDLVREQREKDAAQMRKTSLIAFKMQALAAAKERQGGRDQCDSDDELEIVAHGDMHAVAAEEATERRSRHGKASRGRKMQLLLGGKCKVKGRDLRTSAPGLSKAGLQEGTTQKALSLSLLQRAQEQNNRIAALKVSEWRANGGTLEEQLDETPHVGPLEDVLSMLAKKASVSTGEFDEVHGEGDEGSEEDEEWVPDDRGSASPRGSEDENEIEGENGNENQDENEEVTRIDGADEDDAINRRRTFRRPLALRVSDSEDDDIRRPLERNLVSGSSSDLPSLATHSGLPTMTHRGSLSSFEEPTEDEGDKENNTRLMYDKGDDKENTAVVRHAVDTAPTSLFRLGSRRSMFSDEEEESARKNERQPFKDIDDPFTAKGSPIKSPFLARLQDSTSSLIDNVHVLNSPPFDDGDGESDENAPITLGKGTRLQAGFSDLFELGTQKLSPTQSLLKPLNLQSTAFSQFPEEYENGAALHALKKPSGHELEELSLTLDVRLQPALAISDTLRRKADAIFEKEQALVVEYAQRKSQPEKELYVNEFGFLTQTRPDVSTPEIYRTAPPGSFVGTQGSATHYGNPTQSQSVRRHPLQTLSWSEELDAPAPLQRLKKRSVSPVLDRSPTPSPTKVPSNAIDVLMRNAARLDKGKKALERSDFVEAEAQESDDDEMLGFGGKKGRDDQEEDDDENLDKTLEGLVDDAVMDVDTQAEDLVLEKVKEHREEDDQKLTKLHTDAIEGKFRLKRRDRGVGYDDSEDEDDDDEAARIRRRMYKKRKIDGDNLEALGQNEETRAFYDDYQRNLIDDEDLEFKHLQVPNGNNAQIEDGEEPQEVVSVQEVRERVREMAKREEVPDSLDPHDVSWVDLDDEGESIPVKQVKWTSKPPLKRKSALGDGDYDAGLEMLPPGFENERDRSRLNMWAQGENRTRNVGTGRKAAVTGHNKGKAKSVRDPAHPGPGSSSERRKPVKSESVLSVVSDRSSRFA